MRRVLPALFVMLALAPSAAESQEPPPPVTADPVVVATFDTGTNPFHPCFRRDWAEDVDSPADFIPGYPDDAIPIPLTFDDTYPASKADSQEALQSIVPRKLHFVPETNLSFYGTAWTEFVDDYPHGSQASSQIACPEYGLAPNAELVVINWYDNNAAGPELIRWAAAQPWIDVVHLNIQDIPLPVRAKEIDDVIASGKVVVIAAGNGVNGLGPSYPMEISRWNGPPGSLIAGANDNGGYAAYSNLSPHVVMDGCGTVAASPNSFGSTGFSGTSSASPRITGYVARLIGELRAEFGHTGEGLLTIPEGSPRPATGPLADGVLTAPEVHDAVRATANPNPHASMYDGTGGAGSCIYWVPQPVDSPIAVYAKMGYGEVSEHTLPAAIDVLAGRTPRPQRSEDAFYAVSEQIRSTLFPPD
jgi:hypothetical protein